MSKQTLKVTVSARIDRSVRWQLRRLARERDMTRSQLIESVLTGFVYANVALDRTKEVAQ